MTYLDTSALAKWYLPEEGSEEVEGYIRDSCPLSISLLTKVEMCALVARRCRLDDLDAETKGKVMATFEGDIVAGHLQLVPHTVDAFLAAESLLGVHPEIALTTLDALHLGIMVSAGIAGLATADNVLAAGCREDRNRVPRVPEPVSAGGMKLGATPSKLRPME